jgi:hypothetical protein
MIIVAVKLLSILMNLGKIVLQWVVLVKLSSQYPVHKFIVLALISKQKHLC